MFKKPVPVAVTHDVKLDELKEFYGEAKADFKALLKTVGITLAIGIPCAILFGVAANLACNLIEDNLTASQ
jgi:hypothetical protein